MQRPSLGGPGGPPGLASRAALHSGPAKPASKTVANMNAMRKPVIGKPVSARINPAANARISFQKGAVAKPRIGVMLGGSGDGRDGFDGGADWPGSGQDEVDMGALNPANFAMTDGAAGWGDTAMKTDSLRSKLDAGNFPNWSEGAQRDGGGDRRVASERDRVDTRPPLPSHGQPPSAMEARPFPLAGQAEERRFPSAFGHRGDRGEYGSVPSSYGGGPPPRGQGAGGHGQGGYGPQDGPGAGRRERSGYGGDRDGSGVGYPDEDRERGRYDKGQGQAGRRERDPHPQYEGQAGRRERDGNRGEINWERLRPPPPPTHAGGGGEREQRERDWGSLRRGPATVAEPSSAHLPTSASPSTAGPTLSVSPGDTVAGRLLGTRIAGSAEKPASSSHLHTGAPFAAPGGADLFSSMSESEKEARRREQIEMQKAAAAKEARRQAEEMRASVEAAAPPRPTQAAVAKALPAPPLPGQPVQSGWGYGGGSVAEEGYVSRPFASRGQSGHAQGQAQAQGQGQRGYGQWPAGARGVMDREPAGPPPPMGRGQGQGQGRAPRTVRLAAEPVDVHGSFDGVEGMGDGGHEDGEAPSPPPPTHTHILPRARAPSSPPLQAQDAGRRMLYNPATGHLEAPSGAPVGGTLQGVPPAPTQRGGARAGRAREQGQQQPAPSNPPNGMDSQAQAQGQGQGQGSQAGHQAGNVWSKRQADKSMSNPAPAPPTDTSRDAVSAAAARMREHAEARDRERERQREGGQGAGRDQRDAGDLEVAERPSHAHMPVGQGSGSGRGTSHPHPHAHPHASVAEMEKAKREDAWARAEGAKAGAREERAREKASRGPRSHGLRFARLANGSIACLDVMPVLESAPVPMPSGPIAVPAPPQLAAVPEMGVMSAAAMEAAMGQAMQVILRQQQASAGHSGMMPVPMPMPDRSGGGLSLAAAAVAAAQSNPMFTESLSTLGGSILNLGQGQATGAPPSRLPAPARAPEREMGASGLNTLRPDASTWTPAVNALGGFGGVMLAPASIGGGVGGPMGQGGDDSTWGSRAIGSGAISGNMGANLGGGVGGLQGMGGGTWSLGSFAPQPAFYFQDTAYGLSSGGGASGGFVPMISMSPMGYGGGYGMAPMGTMGSMVPMGASQDSGTMYLPHLPAYSGYGAQSQGQGQGQGRAGPPATGSPVSFLKPAAPVERGGAGPEPLALGPGAAQAAGRGQGQGQGRGYVPVAHAQNQGGRAFGGGR